MLTAEMIKKAKRLLQKNEVPIDDQLFNQQVMLVRFENRNKHPRISYHIEMGLRMAYQ